MSGSRAAPKGLVEAVQAVFSALEPFDDDARQRIISSAASLLGTRAPALGHAIAHPSQSHSVASARPGVSDRPLSPVELIQEKKPATNAQRLAVFAYYRERVEGLSRFAKDDLKPYFAKAKQLPPQNYDRDFRQAVKLGWIYEDGEDSYLTSKGLELVEAGFGGKLTPRGSERPTRRGATKKGNAKRSSKRK
jgi:hypothetical protein